MEVPDARIWDANCASVRPLPNAVPASSQKTAHFWRRDSARKIAGAAHRSIRQPLAARSTTGRDARRRHARNACVISTHSAAMRCGTTAVSQQPISCANWSADAMRGTAATENPVPAASCRNARPVSVTWPPSAAMGRGRKPVQIWPQKPVEPPAIVRKPAARAAQSTTESVAMSQPVKTAYARAMQGVVS